MNRIHYALLTVALVAGCTPSGNRPFIGAPAASPSPSAVTLSSTKLTFTAAGASAAQTVTVAQTNYAGSFTPSTTTCTGIATIAQATATSFMVTPVAAGSCNFTISGGSGSSATLAIGVTTTTVGGS